MGFKGIKRDVKYLKRCKGMQKIYISRLAGNMRDLCGLVQMLVLERLARADVSQAQTSRKNKRRTSTDV